MTSMLHRFDTDNAFDRRRQLAELEYVASVARRADGARRELRRACRWKRDERAGAQLRLDQRAQPEPRDPRDLVERLGELGVDVALDAARELGDDAGAVVALDGEDERKAELRVVRDR